MKLKMEIEELIRIDKEIERNELLDMFSKLPGNENHMVELEKLTEIDNLDPKLVLSFISRLNIEDELFKFKVVNFLNLPIDNEIEALMIAKILQILLPDSKIIDKVIQDIETDRYESPDSYFDLFTCSEDPEILKYSAKLFEYVDSLLEEKNS